MIDEYRLVDSIARNTQHVVSPHGEKIAVVIKTYSGVSVSSLNSKLPQKLGNRKYGTGAIVKSGVCR